MGIRPGRHADRGDPAVARLRLRQSDDAAAAAGHGDACCATRSCRTSCPPTRGGSARACSPACRSCSSTSSRIRRPTAGRRRCTLLVSAGAPLESETVRGVPRALRREDPFLLRHQRNRRHRVRRQRRRSTTAPTVGRPLPGVTVDAAAGRRHPDGYGRIHVRSARSPTATRDGTAGDGFVDGGFLTGDYGALTADGGWRWPAASRRSSTSRPQGAAGRSRARAAVDRRRRRRARAGAADASRGEQIACSRRRRPADSSPADRAPVLRRAAGAAQDSAHRRLRRRDAADGPRQDRPPGARALSYAAHRSAARERCAIIRADFAVSVEHRRGIGSSAA